MSRIPASEKRIDLALVGFSRTRAELLCAAMSQAKPELFNFKIVDGPLSNLDISRLRELAVLATGEELAEGPLLLSAARKLRTEDFFWEPLHLCVRTPLGDSNLEREWAIYFHSLPLDVRDLIASIYRAEPLRKKRREEIVVSMLTFLADDLSSYISLINPTKALAPDRVRASIQSVLQELNSTAGESFNILRQELKKQGNLPHIEAADISHLIPLVIEGEARAREMGEAGHLLSSLHTLNNILRLAADPAEGDIEETANRVVSRLRALEDRGLAYLPDWISTIVSELCEKLPPLLRSVTAGNVPDSLLSELSQFAFKLHSRITLAVKSTPSSGSASIKRIVIVEDDVEWRRRIIKVLQGMFGDKSITIQEAGNVNDAKLLLDVPGAALVLVDLGLPVNDLSSLVPDAGLSLIKQLIGAAGEENRSPHHFIILTASENYTKAVHEALSFGLSPANYLQKNPRTWESTLRAQVRLALRPSPMRPPKIEVFKRTGRIARVEGLEVKLDYPLWCLLAVLAQGRRGRWHETKKLAHVLYWNYSLNPESRSRETDALDPEERILLQLPHYSSNLRLKLSEVYARAVHKPLPADIICFNEELGYCLNAQAQVLDRVDEHFRIGHRPSVLVIEDNDEWGRAIVHELEQRGFNPRLARWVEEARQLIASDPPDLISLDIELPTTYEEWLAGQADAKQSLELLSFIQQHELRVPVAILTAVPWRDAVMLEMLRQGIRIDDYLSKYSSQPILRLTGSLARLWQESLTATRILEWDPLTPLYPIEIDPAQSLLTSVAGYPVKPSGKGREILKALSETPNVFVSRSELLDVVYGNLELLDDGPDDPDKALNQHIKRLRQSISKATGHKIPGEHVICGERGIYWLRGVVQ